MPADPGPGDREGEDHSRREVTVLRNYLLVLVAAGLMAFAVFQVVAARHEDPPPDPLGATVPQPSGDALAGLGLVEARTEDIAVAAHRPGVVAEVSVRALAQV